MHTRTLGCALGVGMVLGLFFCAPVLAADPPPVEAYGKLPSVMSAELSPDGTMVAVIVPIQGRAGLAIHHLDGTPPTVIPPSKFEPYWKIGRAHV